MIRAGCRVDGARVGILGLTFKEDVPDLRNTRVVDVVAELREYGVTVLVHDPMAEAAEAQHEYGLDLASLDDFTRLDALILAVGHKAYRAIPLSAMRGWFATPDRALLLDLKGLHDARTAEEAGFFAYWRL